MYSTQYYSFSNLNSLYTLCVKYINLPTSVLHGLKYKLKTINIITFILYEI